MKWILNKREFIMELEYVCDFRHFYDGCILGENVFLFYCNSSLDELDACEEYTNSMYVWYLKKLSKMLYV